MEWLMKTLEWLKRCLSPKLDRNTANQERILREIREMKQALQDLTDAVAQQTTVVQSVVTLVKGLADQISAANAAEDSEAIEGLVTQLRASTDALAASVQANTPPAPTPDPVPTPAPVPTPDTPPADGGN